MQNQTLKWALIASVILNLFLIGGFIAGAYKLHHHRPQGYGEQNALRFAADDLSETQKRAFRKAVREARKSGIPLLQASGEARAEVVKQLGNPSFDKTAVENAFAHSREADRATRMHIENILIAFAEKLTPEERQKLALGLAQKGPLRQPPMLQKLKEHHDDEDRD